MCRGGNSNNNILVLLGKWLRHNVGEGTLIIIFKFCWDSDYGICRGGNSNNDNIILVLLGQWLRHVQGRELGDSFPDDSKSKF